MKKFHYYRQKTKTGCFLYTLCTALQMSRKKLEEKHGEVIKFYKYNYLSYYSVAKIIQREGREFSYLVGSGKTFKKSWSPALLGINLRNEDCGATIHSCYWDGERVYDPKGLFYNIEDLKVVNAIPIFEKGYLDSLPLKESGEEHMNHYLKHFKKGFKENEKKLRNTRGRKISVKESFEYLKIID